MQEKIVLFILSISFISCQSPSLMGSSQTKSSRHSYGLLGDSFGIVTPEDIAVNSCHVKPVPFSENSTTYQYWQCFDLKQATLFCDEKNYNEEEGKYQTYMVISGIRGKTLHEYIANRPLTLSQCHKYKKIWEQLVKGEQYVCVSGSLIDIDRQKKNRKDRETFSWIFDRFKTKKGCYSYFMGGCSLKEQIEHHDCKLESNFSNHSLSLSEINLCWIQFSKPYSYLDYCFTISKCVQDGRNQTH